MAKANVDIFVNLDELADGVLAAMTEEFGRAIVRAARPHVPVDTGALRKSARSRVVDRSSVRITYLKYNRKIEDRTRAAVALAITARRVHILKRVAAAGGAALKQQER